MDDPMKKQKTLDDIAGIDDADVKAFGFDSFVTPEASAKRIAEDKWRREIADGAGAAERLLGRIPALAAQHATVGDLAAVVAQAQVHATLALTAAIQLATSEIGGKLSTNTIATSLTNLFSGSLSAFAKNP